MVQFRPVVEVGGIVALNVVSVVGIVALNKAVYRRGFNFATLLMCFHFLCTWVFVTVANHAGWFESKRIDRKFYIILGFAQMSSVVLVNLSLLNNTVGTYQLFKFTNVFMTAALEYFWKGKVYSFPVYIALVTLVAGVCFATISQVVFSGYGLAFGLLGSAASAWYQVSNKAVQVEHQVKPFQLLQYEQPYSALFATIVAFFTDDILAFANFRWLTDPGGTDASSSNWLILLILLSGIFAFGVNATTYLIIGRTGPLTFAVMGHVKTICIFLWGFVVLREKTSLKYLMGMFVAFVSLVVYGHLIMNEPPPATLLVEEEDHKLEAAEKRPRNHSRINSDHDV